jgi:hypothetical protein
VTVALSDFLRARVAEDEKRARLAHDENPSLDWEPCQIYDGVYTMDLMSNHPEADSQGVGEDVRIPREMARHIAHHDPDRVLAKCEAQQQIIALLDEMEQSGHSTLSSYAYHLQCLHALPWADHPDYREAWIP